MTDLLYIEKLGSGYGVYYSQNDFYMGEFQAGDDGFYVYWPQLKPGYWPAYLLREMANKLDELNVDWDKELTENLQRL